ncbi:MAG: hypothetical protein ACREFX_03895 [Opitutaceae bacterium]
MNHENMFSVSRFKNRNGVFSWRVGGSLHGVRIRRNFKTQEEAAAEKAALELKAMQSASGLQSATTFLAADQLREAEAVFRRLAGRSHPLSFYVDFALANYREPVTQEPLTEAVAEYVATKQHEHEQDLLSEPHLTRMKRDLKRLEKHFPNATVAELTGARLVGYFEARNAAIKTYNNRRGIVSTFLKFALQRDWITDNPLAKIQPRRIRLRRGCAITFAASQAAGLMAHVEEHYPARCAFLRLVPLRRHPALPPNRGNPPAPACTRQTRRQPDPHRRRGLQGARAAQRHDSAQPRGMAPGLSVEDISDHPG